MSKTIKKPAKTRTAGGGKNQPSKAAKSQPAKDGKTQPMKHKEDVQKSNDEHIDADFPGYPHDPASEKNIHNGSAGAFEGTENFKGDYDDDNERFED